MISESTLKEIDRWCEKYPEDQRRSAVLTALQLVQVENKGHLTEELMNEVAEFLQMPRATVYEVATFYSMYNLQPVGKHMINVCSNISCMLNGANDIVTHIEKRLNIKAGETSADGQFTLIKEVECLAACCGAPMMQINHKHYYENLTPEKVDAVLDEWKNKGVGE